MGNAGKLVCWKLRPVAVNGGYFQRRELKKNEELYITALEYGTLGSKNKVTDPEQKCVREGFASEVENLIALIENDWNRADR